MTVQETINVLKVMPLRAEVWLAVSNPAGEGELANIEIYAQEQMVMLSDRKPRRK